MRQSGTHYTHADHERLHRDEREHDELDDLPLPMSNTSVATAPRQASNLGTSNASSEPLIDKVTNNWRSKECHDDRYHADDSQLDDAFSSSADYKSGLRYWRARGVAAWKRHPSVPQRLQRLQWSSLIAALSLWVVVSHWMWPYLREHAALDRGWKAATADPGPRGGPPGGHNMEVHFDDMIQVQDLSRDYLPGGAHSRRLVFVGDVHGCRADLERLLERVSFRPRHDHLVLTGDTINKGPDSPGVVDLLLALGASGVRGNHEDRVLLLRRDLQRKGLMQPSKEQLEHERKQYAPNDFRARETARSLSDAQARYLASLPVVLRVGRVRGMGGGGVVVAHAGLVPGVEPERQDPFLAMNMRSMNAATLAPSEDRGAGSQWSKVWDDWQRRQADDGTRMTAVYGHDSKLGLNIRKWAKGLDSGCVNGDKLTALVVDGYGEQTIEQVRCGKHSRE